MGVLLLRHSVSARCPFSSLPPRRTLSSSLPLAFQPEPEIPGSVIPRRPQAAHWLRIDKYTPSKSPASLKKRRPLPPSRQPPSSTPLPPLNIPYSDPTRPTSAFGGDRRPIPKLSDASPEGFQKWLGLQSGGNQAEPASNPPSASSESASWEATDQKVEEEEGEEVSYRIPTAADLRPVRLRGREIYEPKLGLSFSNAPEGPVPVQPQWKSKFNFRPSPYETVDSWRALKLPLPLRAALERSFPYIVKPTPFQAELLQAIITGRDILTRQGTGSGKSLALLLALLSQKPPDYWPNPSPPLSLLLLPSSTLVEQLHSWASSLIPSGSETPLTLPLYVPSSSNTSFESLVAPLLIPPTKDKPHPKLILATPQALLRALADPRIPHSQNPTLFLDMVRTIAVDEADTTLNISPTYLANLEKDRVRRKKNPGVPTRAHPSSGMLLMRQIFTMQAERKEMLGERWKSKPQVILASASLNEDVKEVAEQREKWIYGVGSRIEIEPKSSSEWKKTGDSPKPEDHIGRMKRQEDGSYVADLSSESASSSNNATNLPPSPIIPTAPTITHHVITVSLAGTIQNHTTPPPLDEPVPKHLQGGDPPSSGHRLVSRRSMDAFAQLYHSLDPRPHRSLLVVPSGGSMPKILAELAELEIKAKEIVSVNARERVTKTGSGKMSAAGKVLGLSAFKRTVDEPLLYVVDQAFVRGLDIPSLSHVFVFANALQESNDYLHIAGRVGRLSSPAETPSSNNIVFTIVDLPLVEPPSRTRVEKRIRFFEKDQQDGKITEEKKIELVAQAEKRFSEAMAAVESGELVEAELARIDGLFDELKKMDGGEKSEAGKAWRVSKCDLVD